LAGLSFGATRAGRSRGRSPPARRHAALGVAPGGQRRHLGGLRVWRGADPPAARRL